MANFSKLSNLSRGGKSVQNYNRYTGKVYYKKSNYKPWIIAAVVLILLGGGLVILDKTGYISLGIFPEDKKEQ